MQFVYALTFLVALATISAYEYTDDFKNFNIDDAVSDPNKLKSLVGCFLDNTPCSSLSEQLKRDLPDAYQNACQNCTAEQKVIFRKFLDGLKKKLPEEYEAFNKKYDPEGKYLAPLKAVIA